MNIFVRIKNLFINNSVINGFPRYLKKDVKKALKIIPMNLLIGTTGEFNQNKYVLNNEKITFPNRTYQFDVSDNKLKKLNKLQQNILHCIYTRNCDGYVREKHLKKLLSSNYCDWAIPYIVKICDEYVIEILELTYSALRETDTNEIKDFCIKNSETFCKNYSRMISYWNEYYRDSCLHYKDYVGEKLFVEYFGYSHSMVRKHKNIK